LELTQSTATLIKTNSFLSNILKTVYLVSGPKKVGEVSVLTGAIGIYSK